jgi:hypothetical protein
MRQLQPSQYQHKAGRLLRVLRYTTSGTFVKQAGENTVEVTVIGAGGPSMMLTGVTGEAQGVQQSSVSLQAAWLPLYRLLLEQVALIQQFRYGILF